MDDIELPELSRWLEAKEKSLVEINKHKDFEKKIVTLKSFLKDRSTYLSNKESATSIIKEIDKLFDDLAGMKEEQMHTLYNIALVDKDTNSALNNNLLAKKREILKERELNGVYILPATRRAFDKYYTKDSKSDLVVQLWTKPDRDAYFEKIKVTYERYIKPTNN